MDVEYDQSEWVEERLVDIIRVSIEVIAQDVSFQSGDGADEIVCCYEDGFETFCQDSD
jgi:hypothetical protein